jgi:hypothetical protein
MKILRTLVAAAVIVCASSQFGHAAQMALSLDGEDFASFVAVPNNDVLTKGIGSNLTIEAWIKPAANLATATHPGNEYIILNKEDSYEIGVRNNDVAVEGTFQAAIQPLGASWAWTEDSGASLPTEAVVEDRTIPVDKWTHVAATYDGLVIRCYVNGKLYTKSDWADANGDKGVIAYDQGTSQGKSTLKLGRRGRGVEDHSIFNGLIDEVRISKVVRYEEKGFTVPDREFKPDADTIALYHLNEVSTTAADVAALQAKFDAEGATADDGAGEAGPPLDVKGVLKDESALGNFAALIKNAKLVPADTPIKDVNAP